MLSNFIQYCKDPILVAKIQEYFGIENHYEKVNCEKTSDKFESDTSPVNETKGDVKSSSSLNGFYNQENEITARERHKDEILLNNDTPKQDTEQHYTIKNYFWYYLFLFGTELGDEIFYSTFMPFWIWNIDGSVGRRIILVWSIIMSVGQILKDIICWPRPSCPPAVRLQKKWSLEYGMPSTHAMVAISIPFGIIFFTNNKYIYSLPAGFTVAILWCLLICVSRLYLGMHTVLDVLAGLTLAIVMMIILVPIVDMYDDYLVTSNWAILALIIISIVVIVYYPTSDKWTPTRGDTALVVSTAAGFHFGYWINFKIGNLTAPLIPPPYEINWPTHQIIGKTVLRTFLGFASILIFKPIIKSLVYIVMCAILKINSKELQKSENSLENKNKILVDLVYKYVFCFVITIGISFLLPKIFVILGTERSTFYSEL